MKKQNIIAAAALTAALISGMAAPAFAAEADGAAEAVRPSIYTGFQWEHERDEEKNRYTAESIIPQAFIRFYHLNPLYQIIYFTRCILIGGVSPAPITYLYCLLVSAVPLVL